MEGMYAVQLVDKEGNVVGFLACNKAEKSALRSAESLPVTLDWYRDATKWLITLAAGAAVLGLGFFDKAAATALQRILFSASGVVLLIAILLGIFCHLWILSYANQWEYNQSEINDGNPMPDAGEMKKAHDNIGRLYHGLLWSFFIGMLLFGALGFARLWQKGQQEGQGKIPVIPLSVGGEVKAILWDAKRGEVWVVEEFEGPYKLKMPKAGGETPAAARRP